MLEWMILPLKRYAEFSGRSRRMEFWSFALLNVIVSVALMVLLLAGGLPLATLEHPEAGLPAMGAMFWIVLVLVVLWSLGTFIPSIAVTVRRLHDRDMSGWWYLGFLVASMIPFVNFIAGIAFLVLMFLPGTPGPNRFGPDPKDPTSANVFA